jgi:hypothetical protein
LAQADRTVRQGDMQSASQGIASLP